jgi:hypothetical protein
MTNSMKPGGRIDFVLRILLITVLGFVCAQVLRSDALLHLSFLPQVLRVLLQATAFCLVGMYSANAINERFLDTELPRWCRYPAFAVWLLSTSLPFIWTWTWPYGLSLFLFLLIAGAIIPSNRVSAKPASVDDMAEDDGKVYAPDRMIPARLLIGPVGFLRSLLTFACIGLPLIWLEGLFGRGLGAFVAYLGYSILYFVWLFKVFGRFADSGRSSNWYWFPFCITVSIVPLLPFWYKLINRYEALAMFLLIQVPLALMRSEVRPEEPAQPQKTQTEYRKNLELKRKNAKPFMVGPFAFVIRLLVIACLWVPLIYMENASGNGPGKWFSFCGYFILSFAWIMNAAGRFTDANWAFGWHTSQYCLVVSVASLMPVAVHWINGYEALAIFVLIQLPTVLLQSKPGGGWGGQPRSCHTEMTRQVARSSETP